MVSAQREMVAGFTLAKQTDSLLADSISNKHAVNVIILIETVNPSHYQRQLAWGTELFPRSRERMAFCMWFEMFWTISALPAWENHLSAYFPLPPECLRGKLISCTTQICSAYPEAFSSVACLCSRVLRERWKWALADLTKAPGSVSGRVTV